jgi:hypothetical protein
MKCCFPKFHSSQTCFLQCYTHNNLGWKINVVDVGHHSGRNGTNAAVVAILSSLLLFITVLLGLVR